MATGSTWRQLAHCPSWSSREVSVFQVLRTKLTSHNWLHGCSTSQHLSVCHVSLKNFLPILPQLTYMAVHSFCSLFHHCHIRYQPLPLYQHAWNNPLIVRKGLTSPASLKKAADHNQAALLLLGICSRYQITLGYLWGARRMWWSKTSYVITQELKEREEGAGFPQFHPSEFSQWHKVLQPGSISDRLHHLQKVPRDQVCKMSTYGGHSRFKL